MGNFDWLFKFNDLEAPYKLARYLNFRRPRFQMELPFELTFYHHVKYIGLCNLNAVNSTNITSSNSIQSNANNIGILTLACIAFILNLLALIVFGVNERKLHFASTEHSQTDTRSNKINTLSSQKDERRLYQSNLSTHRRKSSVTLSLMILCISECLLNLATLLFTMTEMVSTSTISNRIVKMESLPTVTFRIKTLSVFMNLTFFFIGVSVAFRNWCMCLITIARAEVVLWPLGSKSWQRVFRSRGKFLVVFSMFVLITIILGYVKHADLIGVLCYSPRLQRVALWSETFMMDREMALKFQSIVLYPFQNIAPLILILIFSILIVIRLMPLNTIWTESFQGSANNQHSTTCHANSVQEHALNKRRKSQLKATKIVLLIAFLFLLLEPMSSICTWLESMGLLHSEGEKMRTLIWVANMLLLVNSIANFFVFFVTLNPFRAGCLELLCCVKPKMNGKVQTNETLETDHKVSSSATNSSLNRTSSSSHPPLIDLE